MTNQKILVAIRQNQRIWYVWYVRTLRQIWIWMQHSKNWLQQKLDCGLPENEWTIGQSKDVASLGQCHLVPKSPGFNPSVR